MPARGRLAVHRLASEVLTGNALGDPTERNLTVYVPPGYDDDPSRSYPALLALTGFTGTGAMLFNIDPLAEDLASRLDRLIASGACPPILVAAPDCFTRLGGNQYLNSTATGRYEDYLLEEVVPFVKRTYRTGRWGVFGKSSGGYGSIVQAMRHPEVFDAVADHSGDSNFELAYIPDFPEALDRWREAGGPAKWLDAFWADPNRHRKKHHKALNALAMAAHYSPNPASPHLGIDFPFDLETGVFHPEVWKRWQDHDPVRMVARYAENLKALALVYTDCGTQDEFSLHWGARALVAAMRRNGVEPVHHEFDDGHMSVSYRYDVSLPLLGKALA
ncbi:MAG: esterase [Planctomycetes bacterium]|nr:esterase [Planctomycetota bacterium]